MFYFSDNIPNVGEEEMYGGRKCRVVALESEEVSNLSAEYVSSETGQVVETARHLLEPYHSPGEWVEPDKDRGIKLFHGWKMELSPKSHGLM